MSESDQEEKMKTIDKTEAQKAFFKNAKFSRRNALLGALLLSGVAEAKAGSSDCSCLPAPDCSAVCPNGGEPRGDGTQACDCFDNPPQPTLASVAYTGRYSDLVDKPPRAGSDRDGGDANNAKKVNGYSVTHSYVGGAQQIVVFNGNRLDYINRSDISGNLPQIGGKNFTVTVNGKAKTTNLTVARDAYGRLSGFWKSEANCNCNCNCDCRNCDCQCGDDGA